MNRRLLLLEPHFVMRRTVVTVARELRLCELHEATSHEAALRMLKTDIYDGMLADIGDDMLGLALVQQVREGSTLCDSTLPIAVMAGRLDAPTIAMFKQLDVRRMMIKPFKVKTAIEVLSSISGVPLPN